MTRAFFISDAHLGLGNNEEEKNKERRLIDFLRYVQQRGTVLYILGDLFDAWLEYRRVIPKGHHRILTALEDLSEANVKVHYLTGNHDFWMRDFFKEHLGIETYRNPIEATIDGKRFYLHHGDGLASKDWGYRLLKKILHNPLCIWLYLWIHPDIGIWLASTSSRKSRNYTSSKNYGNDDGMKRFAEAKIAEGFDYVMMGHRHQPTSAALGKGMYINLGDWITYFTYAEYSDGKLEFKKWEPKN